MSPSLITVFASLLCYHILWGLFGDICFYLLVLLLHSLFPFVFIYSQTFNSSSKDTAVTTAAIELIIRKIIVLLLLTLNIVITHGTISTINFYRAVFDSKLKYVRSDFIDPF